MRPFPASTTHKGRASAGGAKNTPLRRGFFVPVFQTGESWSIPFAHLPFLRKSRGQKGEFDPRITYGGFPLVPRVFLVRCRCAEHREPGLADLLLLGVRQLPQKVVDAVLVGSEEELINDAGVGVV